MEGARFPASEKWPRRCAGGAGGLICLAGMTVLLGWALDLGALGCVMPGWGATMAASTALAFALAGVALVLVTAEPACPPVPPAGERLGKVRRVAARGCAGIVALIGAITLCQYVMGWDLGLDRLGFGEPAAAPGRMSTATALNFLLLGCALLLANRPRAVAAFQLLTMLAGLIGWLGFSPSSFGGAPFIPMPLMAAHTAAAFLVLSAGVLCTRTDGGLMALFAGDTAGGVVARRLLAPALVVPMALAWARVLAQRAGWFGTEAGLSLFALANAIMFGALIWATAALLHRTDAGRKRAERMLQAQLERLNLLHQIIRAVGERQDMHSIFQVVIRSLEDHLSIDFCCVCLSDRVDDALTVTRVGPRSEALAAELAMRERARIPIDSNGLARWVRAQLVYEPDIGQAEFPFSKLLAQGGLRSLVAAPLLVESQVFGVLLAARRARHGFSSGECEFLRQVSEHVALAAHKGRLYRASLQAYDDLRQTQQVVMQQERLRAIRQMVSDIAHSINNAMCPVALYTELLLESEPHLSAPARNYLETIQRAIADVGQTVTRMRECYRQREPRLTLVPVDLNRLAQQVMDLTRVRWSDMPQRRGHVIQGVAELAPDLPAIMGVESEIRETLINLVFDAADAMPDGGRLCLRTGVTGGSPGSGKALEGRRVHVEVTDTGVGMDGETRRRVEAFPTTKGECGTWLGLAMAHDVVQRHGGEIAIESAPARGATVRLSFPEAG